MNAGLVEPPGQPPKPDPVQSALKIAAAGLQALLRKVEPTKRVGFVIVAARQGERPAGNLFLSSNMPEEVAKAFLQVVVNDSDIL